MKAIFFYMLVVVLFLASPASAQETPDPFTSHVSRWQEPTPSGVAPADPALRIGTMPYLVLSLGQAADAATTIDFLSRGWHESNGFIGDSSTRLVLMKAGATLGTSLLMQQLDKVGKQRHSKALIWTGRLIGYGSGAVGIWAAQHNLRSTR